MIALGITGTDTAVGKTVIACALAAAYVRRGARVGVMKPVETGMARGDARADSSRLAEASRSSDDSILIAPYVFSDPVAPLTASRRAGLAIDLTLLDKAFRAVSASRDVVIVEGAGGLMVPLAIDSAFDSLFARWNLGLIIVAPNRLGVVNHTVLTAQAANRAEIPVRAIVLNETTSSPADPSAQGNAALIRELLPGTPVTLFPWMAALNDFDALARGAEDSALVASLGTSWRKCS